MGASGSKSKTQLSEEQQQQPPYHGIPCDYNFITINISFSKQMNLSYLSDPNMQMALTDPNEYVPILQQMYQQGFRLLSFQINPGSMKTSGFLSMTTNTTLRAQAIFRKNEPKRPDESFFLEVVKSSIESGTFLTGTNFMKSSMHTETHTQHLYSVIHDFACRGCRLRCIEITGCHHAHQQQMQGPQTMGIGSNMPCIEMTGCHHAHQQQMQGPQTMGIGSNMAYGDGYSASRIYGVDLFFEVPHPSPELYQYQAVPLKLHATVNMNMGFVNQSQQWNLQLDWLGVMKQYLETGWRLVEVFNDMSADNAANMKAFGSSSVTTIQNIVFIFEKPQSRLNDNTPVYEGTMVEYQAKGSKSAGLTSYSEKLDTNWDNSISNMGRFGWELITVFQTPATTTHVKFSSVSVKTLMWIFYQRLIVDEPVLDKSEEKHPPVQF